MLPNHSRGEGVFIPEDGSGDLNHKALPCASSPTLLHKLTLWPPVCHSFSFPKQPLILPHGQYLTPLKFVLHKAFTEKSKIWAPNRLLRQWWLIFLLLLERDPPGGPGPFPLILKMSPLEAGSHIPVQNRNNLKIVLVKCMAPVL